MNSFPSWSQKPDPESLGLVLVDKAGTDFRLVVLLLVGDEVDDVVNWELGGSVILDEGGVGVVDIWEDDRHWHLILVNDQDVPVHLQDEQLQLRHGRHSREKVPSSRTSK